MLYYWSSPLQVLIVLQKRPPKCLGPRKTFQCTKHAKDGLQWNLTHLKHRYSRGSGVQNTHRTCLRNQMRHSHRCDALSVCVASFSRLSPVILHPCQSMMRLWRLCQQIWVLTCAATTTVLILCWGFLRLQTWGKVIWKEKVWKKNGIRMRNTFGMMILQGKKKFKEWMSKGGAITLQRLDVYSQFILIM